MQAMNSPTQTRLGRSPSFNSSPSRDRSLSLSLESSELTVPDALGVLMLSPRADRLEGGFVVENQDEVQNCQLINR